MLTPCQTFAATEGFVALDKLLFTTARRGAQGVEMLCSKCPADAREACGSLTSSIVTPSGLIAAEGVFGGVFHG